MFERRVQLVLGFRVGGQARVCAGDQLMARVLLEKSPQSGVGFRVLVFVPQAIRQEQERIRRCWGARVLFRQLLQLLGAGGICQSVSRLRFHAPLRVIVNSKGSRGDYEEPAIENDLRLVLDPECVWIEAVFGVGRRSSRGGVGHGSGKLAKGLREIKPRAQPMVSWEERESSLGTPHRHLMRLLRLDDPIRIDHPAPLGAGVNDRIASDHGARVDH